MNAAPPLPARAPAALVAHAQAGRHVQIGADRVFVRDQGQGEPVVLMHGIPTSSYLYRKMIPLIAAEGLRAIAFDFLGMGLTAKPRDGDYRWSSMARWTGEVLDGLGLGRVHLVVHDLSGRLGLAWAIAHPERIASLTIMDTPFDASRFRPPFPVSLFAIPVIRQAAIRLTSARLFHAIMKRQGVHDPTTITLDDTRAYLTMLAHDGGRRSYLAIMRGDDVRPDHRATMRAGLAQIQGPIQAVWGAHDRAVPAFHTEVLAADVALSAFHRLEAGHFLQEEVPEACARHIVALARARGTLDR